MIITNVFAFIACMEKRYMYKSQIKQVKHTRSKKTLEKTEGATKNGQSRDTGNIEYTRKKVVTRTPPETGGERRCPRKGNQFPAS